MSRRTLLSLLVPALVACDDGEPTAVRTRTDRPSPELPVARYLTLSPAKARIDAGTQLRLDAVAQDVQRRVIAGAAITWNSADTTIATVAAGGVVHARSAGYVAIGAASGSAAAFSLLQIAINGEYPSGVVIEPATQLITTCRDLSFRGRTDPDIADTRFIWSSSDTTVLRVDAGGTARAVAPGSAQLTLTWRPDTSRTATRTITATTCEP
jgi:uncharacterized protein YjdB